MKLHAFDAIRDGIHARGFMQSMSGPLLNNEIAINDEGVILRPDDWVYDSPMIARRSEGRLVQTIMRRVQKHGFAVTKMPPPATLFYVHEVECVAATFRVYAEEDDFTRFFEVLRARQLGPGGDLWHVDKRKALGTVQIRSASSASLLGIDDYVHLIRKGMAVVTVGEVSQQRIIERSMLRRMNEEMKGRGIEIVGVRVDGLDSPAGGLTPGSHKTVSDPATNSPYEVALSFAGEQREYVGEVARQLASRGVKVFYDEFEGVNLWGKDGIEYFEEIYSRRAAAVAMFISKDYVEKAWPRHERRSALSRALVERKEYVLPIRFDDTPVPGLPSSIQYLDGQRLEPSAVAEAICAKLRS